MLLDMLACLAIRALLTSYGLTHIGMSGNFLYNQGVRRALGFNCPPQRLGPDRMDDSP